MMLDLRLAMVGLSQKEKLSYTGSNPVVPLACGESVGLEAALDHTVWYCNEKGGTCTLAGSGCTAFLAI